MGEYAEGERPADDPHQQRNPQRREQHGGPHAQRHRSQQARVQIYQDREAAADEYQEGPAKHERAILQRGDPPIPKPAGIGADEHIAIGERPGALVTR